MLVIIKEIKDKLPFMSLKDYRSSVFDTYMSVMTDDDAVVVEKVYDINDSFKKKHYIPIKYKKIKYRRFAISGRYIYNIKKDDDIGSLLKNNKSVLYDMLSNYVGKLRERFVNDFFSFVDSNIKNREFLFFHNVTNMNKAMSMFIDIYAVVNINLLKKFKWSIKRLLYKIKGDVNITPVDIYGKDIKSLWCDVRLGVVLGWLDDKK